jgi:hypothetical protein
MLTVSQWPFLLHVLVEVPASINFFFNPASQMQTPHQDAFPIIRQYAVLLMSMNLIAMACLFQAPDDTNPWIPAAMGLYHFAPLYRAAVGLSKSNTGRAHRVRGLGGPVVHFIVHSACLGALINLTLEMAISRS